MRDDADIEVRLPDTLNPWEGPHAAIFADTTAELEVEGARMCAKTTLLLDKEIDYLRRYPGIHSFMCRYSDIATNTKLKPRFEALCGIRKFPYERWDAKELCYDFPNGSKMYAFGIKASSAVARYEKIRGLDVARVYNDQSEEVPKDLGEELRASLRQKQYPLQITFSPNPVPRNHWLANKRHGGFPLDDSVPGRKHYGLSIYDNRYNLPAASIAMMERTYPPDHAKHAAMILGERGPNVIGEAVFEDTFRRGLHVRPIALNPDLDLYEAFHVGKHNPCVTYGQRLFSGGLVLLGGLMGEDLFLEDFLPIVAQHRAAWFRGYPGPILTCAAPDGAAIATTRSRFTSLQLLRAAKYTVRAVEGANAHDVELGLIEQLAAYMRRRNVSGEESFGINSDPGHWLTASSEGVEPDPFMAHAFEANLVWDEHTASVGNSIVRKVHEDDWFANAVHCAQSMEVNFCGLRSTRAETERRRQAQREASEKDTTSGGSRHPSSWMGF